jgi:hypothetical protein
MVSSLPFDTFRRIRFIVGLVLLTPSLIFIHNLGE